MTAENRAQLKALFETGDTLLQTSFENLIDSFTSLTDTAAQEIASDVTFRKDVRVSGQLILTSANAGGPLYPIGGDLGFSGRFYGVPSSVNATGTSQASAAGVSAFVNVIQTCSADSNSGVRLTNLLAGGSCYIINNVSATAIVYGSNETIPNQRIDGNVSVKLMPNQRMLLLGGTSVSCYSIIGAAAGV